MGKGKLLGPGMKRNCLQPDAEKLPQGSGGAGKPAAEMRKTMQELGEDEKKRSGVVHRSVLPPVRFNHQISGQCRISSETTPAPFYGREGCASIPVQAHGACRAKRNACIPIKSGSFQSADTCGTFTGFNPRRTPDMPGILLTESRNPLVILNTPI